MTGCARLSEIAPKGTIVPFDVEYRIVRPDGSERAIRARGFPVYDSAGEIYRVAGIAEDVTERKRARRRWTSCHNEPSGGSES